MSTITEVNADTGEVVERSLTATEQRQAETDRAAAAAEEQAEADGRAARDTAEQDWRAAVGKASTLDEVKAALLGTNLPARPDVRPTQ